MTFARVFATEIMKLRRGRVTWFTLAGLSMGPLGIALFMWILKEPDRASQLGLLGTKADISGLDASWASYAGSLTLVVGIGGMLLLSFIVAYVFGREYAQGTTRNLLALPIGRHWFALAKLAVSAVWWTVLVACVLIEALLIGLALDLPGFSVGFAVQALQHTALAAGISFLLAPVVAWIAIAGRGYMAPLGFALAMEALGNVFGHTGWSVWFPWSIVPALIGMVGKPVEALPAGSYLVLALTFALGVGATASQLRLADNSE